MRQSIEAVELPRTITPEQAFAALRDRPHVFWLDGGPNARDGWSWVGTGEPDDPDAVGAVVLATAGSSAKTGPLHGGWVGWTGYEPGAAAAGAPVTHADPLPAQRWLRVQEVVAFDHATGRAWAGGADAAGLAARVRAASPRPFVRAVPPHRIAAARIGPDDYADRIRRCRAAIRAGDAYLLCLTTRFEIDGPVDPDRVHAALRASSPSHHGLLIRSGTHALVGASPERFLEVDDGIVRTRPIKGTRPRGTDPDSDRMLRDELQASAKERAENVMIVDLMRNDLAPVCEIGGVSVERLLEVESYASVHQLVSTVAGRLRRDVTVADLLRQAFPAGSMTGAPKLSAMTLLHGLEDGPRGLFSGAAGWVGDDGRLDLAMTIRSVAVHPGGAYVGAGGGITWHSVVEEEVDEVALKAAAPLAAAGALLPPGWDARRVP